MTAAIAQRPCSGYGNHVVDMSAAAAGRVFTY